MAFPRQFYWHDEETRGKKNSQIFIRKNHSFTGCSKKFLKVKKYTEQRRKKMNLFLNSCSNGENSSNLLG